MGGDHGAAVVVPAAAIALERRPGYVASPVRRRESCLQPLLAAQPSSPRRSHDRSIAMSRSKMTDKPSQALRAGPARFLDVAGDRGGQEGEADCAVSAGNTGALMAMAKVCLHTMPQIDRPALAAMWPTLRGESIVLDVGASIGADAQHLVDLAIMGAAMARIVFDIDTPDRRPAQCRGRGDQGHRGGQGGRPHAARDRVARSRLSRLRRGRRSRPRHGRRRSSPKASPAISR